MLLEKLFSHSALIIVVTLVKNLLQQFHVFRVILGHGVGPKEKRFEPVFN